MRNTFHQAAITHKGIGIVIDHVMARTVELRRKGFFGNRHAHGITDALPQRACGGFNTGGITVFGVAGGFGV